MLGSWLLTNSLGQTILSCSSTSSRAPLWTYCRQLQSKPARRQRFCAVRDNPRSAQTLQAALGLRMGTLLSSGKFSVHVPCFDEKWYVIFLLFDTATDPFHLLRMKTIQSLFWRHQCVLLCQLLIQCWGMLHERASLYQLKTRLLTPVSMLIW